ncbi:MAG TPA: biotin--[acetyl-CoA-carboxylase] ligase [Acidimicrobiia bacterium]|nr:biotin--[acetyl-CoA-carboxylase] ligase [Acidimicrobiia bacterium]
MLAYRISRLADTTSTNTVALAAGAAGEPEGFVVVADHQTEGRGRLGRAWLAPAGSALLVSVLLRPPRESAHLTVSAVACAAAAACERVAGVSPALKWPNDLVAADRKLGGILAETAGNMTSLAVGLGLNVHPPPDRPAEIAALAVDLDALAGQRVHRSEILDALLVELALRYDRPGSIMAEYRGRCVTIGRRVLVTQSRGEIVGVARAIADDGSLEVETDAGATVTVSAGDVEHVRPA